MANVNGFAPTPWFVGHGAAHSPELFRAMLDWASAGSRGIVHPGDLKVRATAVPGGQVEILPGAFITPNDSVGGNGQSYGDIATVASRVDVTPTGSTGSRVDMIVTRIVDPQYPPFQDRPTAEGTYFAEPFVVEGVDPAAQTAADLNLGYPAVELARVRMPSNTATVTNDMIDDLRQLAQPKRKMEVFRRQSSSWNDIIPADQFGAWPAWEPLFVVPPWATHVVAVMTATGVRKDAGAHIYGEMQLEFTVPGQGGQGVIGTATFEFEGSASASRETMIASGEGVIAPEARGKTRTLRLGAKWVPAFSNNGVPAAGQVVRTTPTTSFIYQIQFEQRVV